MGSSAEESVALIMMADARIKMAMRVVATTFFERRVFPGMLAVTRFWVLDV